MQEVYSNKNASRLHAWYCIVAGASTAPLFWQDNERYNANGVPITDMRDDATPDNQGNAGTPARF